MRKVLTISAAAILLVTTTIIGVAPVSAGDLYSETVDVYTYSIGGTIEWTHSYDGSANPVAYATLAIVADDVDGPGAGMDGEQDEVWFNGVYLGLLNDFGYYTDFQYYAGPGNPPHPDHITTTFFDVTPFLDPSMPCHVLVEAAWGVEIETATLTVVPVFAEVEKHWSYTDVCFQQDNDGDGLYDEDPINFDADGNAIDDDIDGLYNEDPVECDGEYSLGTPLPIIDDMYQLEATVKKGKIRNINPGQFYAVSTVTVLPDLDTLEIYEKYVDVIDKGIGALNPKKGGGKVVVVQMVDGIPRQILDAMDDEVVVDPAGAALVTLEDVEAGTYMVYVKFAPTLKGADWETVVKEATNYNCYLAEVEGLDEQDDCAEAMIVVVEKVPDED